MGFSEDKNEIDGNVIPNKQQIGPDISAWFGPKEEDLEKGVEILDVDLEDTTPLVKRKKRKPEKAIKNLKVNPKEFKIMFIVVGVVLGSVCTIKFVNDIKDSKLLMEETDKFNGIVNRNTHGSYDEDNNYHYYYDVDAIVNEVNTLSNLYYYQLDQKTSAPIAIYSIICDITSDEAKDEFVREMGTVISSNSEFYCNYSGFDYSSFNTFLESSGCENVNDLKKELISDLKEGKKQVK